MISFYEATAYLSAGFLRKHGGKCFRLLSFIGDKTGNGDSETKARYTTINAKVQGTVKSLFDTPPFPPHAPATITSLVLYNPVVGVVFPEELHVVDSTLSLFDHTLPITPWVWTHYCRPPEHRML